MNCRRNLKFVGVCVFAFAVMVPTLGAQKVKGKASLSGTTRQTQSTTAVRVLSKDDMYFGFDLSRGFGVKAFGGIRRHDLALGSVYGGLVLTDILFEDRWFRGNLELLAELLGGSQLDPEDRYVFGLAPSVRYNFVTSSNWVPFVDGGTGLAYTNIGGPDLSTRFQFIVQAGAGTRYFFKKNTAFILQYRWFHLSNADIEEPNHGVNTQLFSLGLSWFF